MFDPWTGSSFGKPENLLNGTRLLILGESHYDSRPDFVGTREPGRTRDVVERWALKEPDRFFTNLTQLVAGRRKSDMTPEEVAAVWDSVMFYNYVPVFAAEKPGVPPTPEMFEAGRKPFLRVLEEHEPEAIIVCGYRLWTPMINGLPEHLRDDAKGQSFRQVGRAIAARIRHPSRYFSAREQHESVTKALFDRIDAARARPAV